MASEGIQELRRLEREAQNLVREQGLAISRAVMNDQDPSCKAVQDPFEKRYATLVIELDAFAAANPHGKEYARLLKEETRRRLDHQSDRGGRAYGRRNQVNEGLKGDYNRFVGRELSNVPGAGTDLLRGGVDQGIRKLVDAVITSNKVPAHVKAEIASNLSGYVKREQFVEDSFFFLQDALMDGAAYLHEKMTYTIEIEATKDRVAKLQQISPQEAAEADRYVGKLGQRSTQLDKEYQERMRLRAQSNRNRLALKGFASFRPNLVLDPARKFIRSLELKAGIKLTASDVHVELGTRVRVVPFGEGGGTQVSPYASAQLGDLSADTSYTATNLGNEKAQQVNSGLNLAIDPNTSVGADYQGTWRPGQETEHSIKASISWRF